MKMIFEEYGRLILAIIAVVSVLCFVLGGLMLFKNMGKGVDGGENLNHLDSEAAVQDFYERGTPVISIPDASKLHLHLGRAEAFKPNDTVACVDKDGAAVETSVNSISFVYEDGAVTLLTDKYNRDTDEFFLPGNVDQPGVLVVTFKAMDRYNVSVTKSVSYVVDYAGN